MSVTRAMTRRKSVLTLAGIAVGLWVILGLTSLSHGAQGGGHDQSGHRSRQSARR